ncbi:XrtA/PEP-CTERM system TPR-repeat protein PrsT [Paraglaciecola arctica]|uniref:XrtA/PEP-CTERM system TPR-repeat protein PrsT n=1 Tax=Paraglaciecola arctica TaxID=1128911 RepID=UPI001C07AA3D|nr:XrtA/PEP-CTERM system TPR-repeat protein PrsT [Paraglaciecola arctica]MBU3005705.1 PEP-CTERM system TPR-repeat protein PrsT [Paraglaciecola arctica]
MTKLHFAVIFSVFLIVTGCTKKTSEEHIALAETKIQENDIPTAIIELKNAISANPQDPKSRFMLGSLYAQRGSSAAAEKELLRASELGYEPNEVLPILANVYSLQFKNAEIIQLVEESRNLSPEVTTSLLLYKALAHFQLDEPYKARKAVEDANEISSDSLYSKLGNAYVDFSNQQIDTSLEKINEILKEQPDFADAHLLKGQLTSVSKDTKTSVESFEKYKELLPQTYQSRVFLANAYIKNKQFEEAEKEIDVLLKVNPEQPFINQLKGVVRFQAQDFNSAKQFAEKAIQNGSDDLPNKIIAGISAFRLGSNEQAYKHMNSIKDKLPPRHPILKILVVLELKLGIANELGSTITSLDGLTEDDVILLSATSAQLIDDGQSTQRKAILEKVDAIKFSDPLRIAQKGMLRLSLDDIDGLSDLEQALALDPDQDTANTALARAYIDNELYDKAIELSKNWIEKKPDQVFGYILAAVSYSKLNKTNQAENMYNEALILDPNNISANTYYSDKAVAEGDKKSAVGFLNKVIRSKPDHIDTLRKYFVLQRDLGNSEDGLRLIERAYDNDPKKLQLSLLFAQALFTQSQYTKSISILEQITTGETTPDKYWVVLSNAYYLNGQIDKAVNVAENWVLKQPNNMNAYFRLITLQEVSKNYSQALTVAKTAQSKFPTQEQFGMFVTYFNLVTGSVEAASLSFNNLSEETKRSVYGQGLLGQILIEKGDAVSALPKLKAFYEQSSTQTNASLVAKAFKELNQFSEAITFLKGHQLKVGKSVVSDIQLAELAISSNNYALASKYYESVLQIEPDNTRALNNLAYILIEEGNHEAALEYARRAAELSPEYPAILDTYATTLQKTGKFNESVKVFEKVYKLDKSNIDVALRYAEALIAIKEMSSAQKVLEQVEEKQDMSFSNKAEIRRLKGKI